VIEKARKQLESKEIDFNAPLAIYVGGFTKQQHIPEILGAIPECPEWEFLFLGEDGKHANAVTETAKNTENAYFVDVVPHEEVPGYLSFADVGFSLSPGERPMKLLEYAAAGLTVLGIPGRRQRVFSDEEILFIEPTSDNIAKVLKTIRCDPESVIIDNSAIQQKAKQNSWDDIAETYYDVFCKLSVG